MPMTESRPDPRVLPLATLLAAPEFRAVFEKPYGMAEDTAAALLAAIDASPDIALVPRGDVVALDDCRVNLAQMVAEANRLIEARSSHSDVSAERDAEVVEWLRESLGMDEEWASIARSIVALKRRLA